jgi:murein L,D-transpeptidase YcbB/YkuD
MSSKVFHTSALRMAMAIGLIFMGVGARADEPDMALRQVIAAEAARSKHLAAFYDSRQYMPIWIGESGADQRRRESFLRTLDQAADHGLPVARYRAEALREQARSARTVADLARLEVAISASFLSYARDVQSGILNPNSVDDAIKRAAPRRNPAQTLSSFAQSSPQAFLDILPPQSAEYTRLMRAKIDFEQLIARGGWGPAVPGGRIDPGMSSPTVAALRSRLSAMGYRSSGTDATYDDALKKAVVAFQADHGLATDGVVGAGTLAEINRTPEERLQQILVAMERERWINLPRGTRNIEVNLTDFSARIVDNGKVTFETRAVIGETEHRHQSPEFSDTMEFLVVNPTWNVPRSITAREYLPMLQENPNAAAQLVLVDANGQTVPRSAVNFRAYNGQNFPFRLKEPPNDSNALGLVKFMFPNAYNIYLHDTPSKSLFGREVRAFSHGCIRLADPFDFAYALLARQTDDPEALFKARLATGRENVITLDDPVPVHLIYRTAITEPDGSVQFRRDIYGRDAKIFEALTAAGVTLHAAEG